MDEAGFERACYAVRDGANEEGDRGAFDACVWSGRGPRLVRFSVVGAGDGMVAMTNGKGRRGGEKRRKLKPTIRNQLHNQKRHHTPLGIMHKKPPPHPLLAFSTNHALSPLSPPRRHQLLPKMITEILDNGAGLGDDARWGFGRGGGADGDDGGLAEGVDGFEIGRGEAGAGVARVDGEGVGEGKFFEEPEDAVGAGFFEPRTGGGG